MDSENVQLRYCISTTEVERINEMKSDWTFTVSVVLGQLEAKGAAALVGPLCVLTLVGAESPGIMPALIDV